jgi:hypothetical protein
MNMSRKLLWLPFWLGVLLTALGYAVDLPLARLGCFLLAAGLSAGGVFVPQRGYRIAAALLFIVALASAYIVYRHGQKYLSSSPAAAAKAMTKAPNKRAGGGGRMALQFHAGRAWPAAPQHERSA